MHRDHTGWGDERYVNQSGRNDIVAAKAAYDAKNVSFYVRTRQAITPASDKSWMLLYLNVGGTYRKGWLGYDFVVNRHPGSRDTSLEADVGGTYSWKPVSSVGYRVARNELMIVIPRKLLGLSNGENVIDFKWADSVAQTGDPSDFTLNGDSAPDDRFNYRARFP